MQNWPTGNVSSNLVSQTRRMSILSLVISYRGSNLFLIEFTFASPNVNLGGLLFLNSCKAKCERPWNCLLEQSEHDMEFNDLSRFKSSWKLLSKSKLLSSVSFKCSAGHQIFRNFCKKFNSSLLSLLLFNRCASGGKKNYFFGKCCARTK